MKDAAAQEARNKHDEEEGREGPVEGAVIAAVRNEITKKDYVQQFLELPRHLDGNADSVFKPFETVDEKYVSAGAYVGTM